MGKLKFLSMIAVSFIACVSFFSCNNDELMSVPDSIESNVEIISNSDPTGISTKALEIYYVKQIYKTAYKHLHQASGECSWTNYTLASAAIARGNGKNYPYQLSNPTVSDYKRKIKDVKDECGGSKLITKIESYSYTWDKPTYSINARVESKSTFDEAVYLFLGERKRGNQAPCIFIGGAGGIGHYLILWDVEWNDTADNSYVYITDTLDGDENNFWTFEQVKRRKKLSDVIRTKDSVPSLSYYNFMFFD